MQSEPPTDTFLDDLAAGTATPGGGAAAAYAGAMSAGLVAMVARLTAGKKKYAPVEAKMQEIINEADGLRDTFNRAREEDIEAFDAVMDAYRLPKDSDKEKEQRTKEIKAATLHATEVPLGVCRLATQALKLAYQVAKDGNLNAASDAGTAGALAMAALRGASANVRINLKELPDLKQSKAWLEALEALEQEASGVDQDLKLTLQERASISF
jgi:glutamate formiminotransferase/formiminotetrahydrofolate cyclodeaminase